ncbi:MAG: sensor histidine kinase [Oceanisphaera sp.]|uniref:sensor histidine kinase n=1 Tax=Oceanisphaera sp. TaxID=1929979 RepID=UPI003F97F316
MSSATKGFAPRSLLRLVLVAFTVVLLPLILLVIQNGRSLERVILLAQDGIESAVVDTRRASDMNDLALEMERAIRRYVVLENPELRDSYLRLLARYRLELEQLLMGIDGGVLGESLQHQLVYLVDLAQANNEQIRERVVIFNAFSSTTLALDKLTRGQIDERIQQEREHVIVMRQQLWVLSAALGGASLLLALLFTYLIIRPVRQLEQRILNLGAGVYPEQVPIRGPAELVALGDKLHWLHTRLCELEAQKLQFLRHLSHELKTPLASLREGADLLIEQVTGPLNTDQQEVCELLVHNSFRLQELIEQLLDYNRIQQVQVHEEPVAVAPLLEQSLDAHRLTIDNKSLQVSVDLINVCPFADSHRLKLVLDNLVSNAVNYADVAGVLDINATLSGQDYILTVANTGQPIPEQDRDRIFEPFVQGTQVRKGVLKGSGIGLSIAREAAENMGGQLVLNTNVTDLVCFELRLPHDNNTGIKDE